MSEFKEIKTQEEFNEAIKDRLERQKETIEKQYADYDQIKTRNSQLETEVAGLQSTIEESNNAAKTHEQEVADLNAKIADQETAQLKTKIALEAGLPIHFASRLVGEDEKSLKADAEKFTDFKPKPAVPPLRNPEPPIEKDEDADLKEMLQKLNERGE